jgi:hypothetical protein
LKILPSFNFHEGISSQDKIQGVPELLTEISDRINGIGFPRSLKLNIRSGEPGILPSGSLHHLEAVVGLNNLFSHLVGRVRSWNKDHFLESKGLSNLFGSPQVTQVNGIEGTPKKPNPPLSSPLLDLSPLLTQLKFEIRISQPLPPPKRLRAGRHYLIA